MHNQIVFQPEPLELRRFHICHQKTDFQVLPWLHHSTTAGLRTTDLTLAGILVSCHVALNIQMVSQRASSCKNMEETPQCGLERGDDNPRKSTQKRMGFLCLCYNCQESRTPKEIVPISALLHQICYTSKSCWVSLALPRVCSSSDSKKMGWTSAAVDYDQDVTAGSYWFASVSIPVSSGRTRNTSHALLLCLGSTWYCTSLPPQKRPEHEIATVRISIIERIFVIGIGEKNLEESE